MNYFISVVLFPTNASIFVFKNLFIFLCKFIWTFYSFYFSKIGTNKLASQKGMSIGKRRFGADIVSGAGSQASQGILPFQSGNPELSLHIFNPTFLFSVLFCFSFAE